MTTEENSTEEVKEFTQTVNVVPSKDDDNDEELIEEEEENETPESSSDEKKESEDESEEEETQEAEAPKTEPKPVEGETPRERALRLEATRLKGIIRDQRKEDLFVKQPKDFKQDEDLAEYDPEELKRFETLATKMGFAKKSEIQNQTIQDRNNNEFESFMDAHPEYAPENDKDGILWDQFKSEFALYTPPQDPKTLKKILNKVHNEIYGVQPAKNLNKISASQEKIKVASHTGASAGKESKPKTQAPSGLRLDGLKGFSDDEIAEFTS